MKITVQRTGGYAGLTEEIAAVNTAQLAPAAARRGEQLIQQAGFFNLPAKATGDAVGADMFRYEIIASDGERQHTVAFTDGSPDAAPLLKLIEDLKQLA
jgi:hypothetical protein